MQQQYAIKFQNKYKKPEIIAIVAPKLKKSLFDKTLLSTFYIQLEKLLGMVL